MLRNVIRIAHKNNIKNLVKINGITKVNYSSATSVSDRAQFPGYKGEFSTNLDFLYPENAKQIPCYRVMNRRGELLDGAKDPKFDGDTLLAMYKNMVQLHHLDVVMYEAQRQGRITFYLTNHGEGAIQIGSAAALNEKDLIFAQYREAGVILWRGYTIDDFCNQIYGNALSTDKGKQMPIHYGSKQHAFVTISSPLATQMPQAAGAAYAYKRAQNGLCVVCYFGDGASSEGDAHVAMNFAAVFDVPLVLFCRNNGYAISTPVREQYRGDGIAARGYGYGITTIRVDGNDLFAVYNATKAAREIAVRESRPVLIEAMTYRLSHHSTSDDSTAYRSVDEISSWEKEDNPIRRFRNYLIKRNLWNESKEAELNLQMKKSIISSIDKAEKTKRGKPTDMFNDVYDNLTPLLVRQREELLDHLKANKTEYPMDLFEKL